MFITLSAFNATIDSVHFTNCIQSMLWNLLVVYLRVVSEWDLLLPSVFVVVLVIKGWGCQYLIIFHHLIMLLLLHILFRHLVCRGRSLTCIFSSHYAVIKTATVTHHWFHPTLRLVEALFLDRVSCKVNSVPIH